jgi:hypothetical protein
MLVLAAAAARQAKAEELDGELLAASAEYLSLRVPYRFCRKFGRPIRLVYVCRQRFRRRTWYDRVQGCTALGFWDTGLKSTPPWRRVEAGSDGTRLG